ncbi:MAG: LptA/OstA family protein [Bacillota bacterium]
MNRFSRGVLFKLALFGLVLNLVLAGQVIAQDKGEQQRANQLEILADEMVLKNDSAVATGNVEVNTAQGQMFGSRLELDKSYQSGLLTGSPKLISQGWEVTGKRFEIDFAKDELFVPKEAHLKSSDLTADADQLQLLYQADQAILTGNVVVINQQRKLTGDKVVVNLKTEELTSEGRSRLKIPQQDLKQEDEE